MTIFASPFSELDYMDFVKAFLVNGAFEDLSFISWGMPDITHFIILGLDDPLFMERVPVKNEWRFVEDPGPALRHLQPVFSQLLEQQTEKLPH